MNLVKTRLQDGLYISGLICLTISLVFFCLPFFMSVGEDQQFSLFVGSFAMTIIFFFLRIAKRKDSLEQNKIHYTILFLILFLVSAYALNRNMSVFDDSANWFCALLIVSCINYMAFAFAEVFPKWTVHVMSALAGISWIAFAYLSLYLLPMCAFGLIGAILFGVGLHAFVPGLFCYYSMRLLARAFNGDKKYWWSFLSGVGGAVAVVIIYAIMWNNNKAEINYALQNSVQKDTGLPVWVNVAEKMPDNFFTRRLLRTGLVYAVPDPNADNFLWRMPEKSWGEKKKHDPLIMISQFLSGPVRLDRDDQVKILQSMYELGHEAQDRLWSGDHLITESVKTEVRLWPDCNLSYTEKTITVWNQKTRQDWMSNEEAIYTFYLPEGATVTSLSLWLNGKEEKGVMTTKEKAVNAYQTIVGKERRDPSVVQWQEGNSVSVRVFPVPVAETRMFKIGITSPLERVNGKLRYENIYFKGPVFEDATEDILIDFQQPTRDFQLPASFTSMSNQSYKRHGNYKSEWSMLINDPGLSKCSFSFDEHTYSLLPYHPKLSPVNFRKIYLDVNRSWSRDEFDKIRILNRDKEVYVFDNTIIQVTDENSHELWNNLHSRQFSLFPLYKMQDPVQSLLVTKNTSVSPSLNQLDGSVFMQKTKSYIEKNPRINLFDFGTDLSPYLASLKEFRVFQYEKGNMRQLVGLLHDNYFPDNIEDDNNVIIHRSDMIIHRTEEMRPSSGPDHMMRLFSYNHIMKKLGRLNFVNNSADDSVIDEAREAYVVSPVSSLVVLETQDDYDRFDITDNNASLKNASLHSKGAVPEPREWALIIMTVVLMVYLIRRQQLRFNNE